MSQLIGVGLRPTHYPYLAEKPPAASNFFEAISENYMDTQGRPREMLRKIRKDFPVAIHGVSMSLASSEGMDMEYLKRLAALASDIEPILISDHLCWTGLRESNIHDLLPFPFTKTSMDQIIANIDCVQNVLKRQILIENVSAYMTFEEDEYREWDFIVEVAKRSGSKLLLDVNNVYVNAKNFGFSATQFLSSIPTSLIGQIHLAGFSDLGDFLFDTHSMPVYPEVWNLFSQLAPRLSLVPVIVEWDEDIPEFSVLEMEVQKAKTILENTHATQLSI